jgi:polysaccharide export outer membrane protein
MNPSHNVIHRHRSTVLRILLATAAAVVLGLTLGCETAKAPAAEAHVEPPPQTLQAGDVIHIAFPGAASMDTTQQIRRDGKVNLSMVGELEAAGKTPADFEKELIAQYSSQLINKEVKVTVVSSSYSVFVTGSVLKPGKIQPDHAITAFEAIMEAGGFDYAKANTSAVRVIRNGGGGTQTYTIDIKAILDGKPSKPFYLQSNDTVYVPEKFQIF